MIHYVKLRQCVFKNNLCFINNIVAQDVFEQTLLIIHLKFLLHISVSHDFSCNLIVSSQFPQKPVEVPKIKYFMLHHSDIPGVRTPLTPILQAT